METIGDVVLDTGGDLSFSSGLDTGLLRLGAASGDFVLLAGASVLDRDG